VKKPDSLRAALTAAFPELGTDPDRLRMWIEQGHVKCWAGGADRLNFTQGYTLTVVIEGWTLPSILIWVVLIDWLRIQQPDLLTPGKAETAIPFEADIVSAAEVDLSFELALTEPVRVTRREDGGFDMIVVSEPDPLFPDAAPVLPSGPLLETVWVDGVQLVPDPY
jgi:hypothetical protein